MKENQEETLTSRELICGSVAWIIICTYFFISYTPKWKEQFISKMNEWRKKELHKNLENAIHEKRYKDAAIILDEINKI